MAIILKQFVLINLRNKQSFPITQGKWYFVAGYTDFKVFMVFSVIQASAGKVHWNRPWPFYSQSFQFVIYSIPHFETLQLTESR